VIRSFIGNHIPSYGQPIAVIADWTDAASGKECAEFFLAILDWQQRKIVGKRSQLTRIESQILGPAAALGIGPLSVFEEAKSQAENHLFDLFIIQAKSANHRLNYDSSLREQEGLLIRLALGRRMPAFIEWMQGRAKSPELRLLLPKLSSFGAVGFDYESPEGDEP
jgi:hypothetical protein